MKDLFQLNPQIISTILQYYDRTEDSLNQDVATLKQWMTTQPHLPEILADKSIQNFLILNKCSIEKAKEKIDTFYTLKNRLPEMYENANPKKLKEVMKIVCWVPLPKLTPDNYRVLFFVLKKKDMIEVLEPRVVFGLACCFQEVRLKEDVMFGDVLVFDMQGLTLGYLSKMTPTLMAKSFTIYKVFSIPLKGIYIINSTSYVNTLLLILKTILKPKLFERIHVCEDTRILTERFPKEIVPKDYGGEEMSTDELQELLQMKLHEYQHRFDELEDLHVNEDLRPQKLENDELLGFHGNFKKLNVD